MGCTIAGYRTFLICCNFALLFVGGSVLILGLKMKWALSVLFLINIPIIAKAVEAVIATGFFISVAGLTGISGACYECMWLLIVHLAALGVIVIMEFCLGVTLMVIKNTVQSAIESSNCNNLCAAALDAMVLDYALPSAGLMMTIIILEALMIYSAIRLYFHIRDTPKTTAVAGPNIVVQNVQMQNVAAPQPAYPQPMYAPQMEYMHHQPQPLYAQPSAPPQYIAAVPEPTKHPENVTLPPEQQQQSSAPSQYVAAAPEPAKRSEYVSLPPGQQQQQQELPPTYAEAAPLAEAPTSTENVTETNAHKESDNPV